MWPFIFYEIFFFTMAQQPYWSKASLLSGIHDHIQLDAPQTVGLLWTSDQLGAETSI